MHPIAERGAIRAGLGRYSHLGALPPPDPNDLTPEAVLRVEVINDSAVALNGIEMFAQVTFRRADPVTDQPNATRPGEVTANFFYALKIDRIEPGEAGKFVFFAEHHTDQFAFLALPKEATAQPSDRDDRVRVTVNDPTGPVHQFSPTWESRQPKLPNSPD